ncbi:serine/threonine-protein kinase [Microseira wollei]|uniref:non-specific serine/threonine protein kinase n=1 Tax=Microseira wollei NIES-4236 TaxID=2530354 RepID=A0AAV3XHY0_9CYAN|nr:serine/threonine-protein kinase [Microseira wollei]GET41510.1 serine/Threonine protein kinase [Microseira wollei NIES-4236]
MLKSSPLTAGSTLEKRYRIVRELGYGGFGRTYLAEDLNRYNEYCVLKEFAPQVQDPREVRKAEELFKREAGVLYKLQHAQIPRFRELMRMNVGNREALFLVQDYVEGQTYTELLQSHPQQRFSEAEVVQLLRQILPVLQYIHSLGVVHRDISPENLIQRSGDKLPVLIDFGAVKQAATTIISQSTGRPMMTLLGKEGFAPQEQIQHGQAFPSSDLYSLAVTVLVLLTGKDPKALYDSSKAAWHWRQHVSVSSGLGNLVDKMLAYRPRDRYSTAADVLQALNSANLNLSSPVPAPPPAASPKLWSVATHAVSQMQTVNFVGRIQRHLSRVVSGPTTTKMRPPNSPQSPINNDLLANLQAAFQSMLLVLLLGMGAWGLVKVWTFVNTGVSGISRWQPPSISLPVSLPPISLPSPSLGQQEIAQLNEIVKRRQALGIAEVEFNSQVDALFYRKYPQLKGRRLTGKPEDANYRQRWRETASALLDRLENGEGI